MPFETRFSQLETLYLAQARIACRQAPTRSIAPGFCASGIRRQASSVLPLPNICYSYAVFGELRLPFV